MESGLGANKSFTIADGGTSSNVLNPTHSMDRSLYVLGKTVTDGAITYKYQVSVNGTDYGDLLEADGTAIIPPLQDKAKVLVEMYPYIKIVASGAVTGAKVWHVAQEL